MAFAGTTQKCQACDKTVYLVDQLAADNRIFHKACFRCHHCRGTLKVHFSSSSFLFILIYNRWIDFNCSLQLHCCYCLLVLFLNTGCFIFMFWMFVGCGSERMNSMETKSDLKWELFFYHFGGNVRTTLAFNLLLFRSSANIKHNVTWFFFCCTNTLYNSLSIHKLVPKASVFSWTFIWAFVNTTFSYFLVRHLMSLSWIALMNDCY